MVVAQAGEHADGGAVWRRRAAPRRPSRPCASGRPEVEQDTVDAGDPLPRLRQARRDGEVDPGRRLVEQLLHEEGVGLVILDQQHAQSPRRPADRGVAVVARPRLRRRRGRGSRRCAAWPLGVCDVSPPRRRTMFPHAAPGHNPDATAGRPRRSRRRSAARGRSARSRARSGRPPPR